ncbi:hypothetical protein KCP74_21360 [Salmonella enterica subsp. enterica]|nr:hypothetical protein KCP74_21360 [Salmonella enterica subsp. enterica]
MSVSWKVTPPRGISYFCALASAVAARKAQAKGWRQWLEEEMQWKGAGR